MAGRHAVSAHSFSHCGQTPAVANVFHWQWQPGAQCQRSFAVGRQAQRGQRIFVKSGANRRCSTPGVRFVKTKANMVPP